jgi:cytoskeleton protein RodZ
MTEQPGAAAALAATPGATLAAARQANGLSIAQVAEQMRLHPRQVEAMEGDRYGELPGPVFVRGFVRNYARLLKLDPVPLLHALEPALEGEVPLRAHEIAGTLPESTRRSHGRLWLAMLAVVAFAAAIAAAYEWWRGRAPAAETEIGAVAPGTTPPPPQAPAPGTAASMQETIPLSPERIGDTAVAPAAEPVPQNDVEMGGNAAPAQAATALPSGPAPAGDIARMEIAFDADSWVEVRDGAGVVQFSGTIPSGSTRTFEAQPPVDVIVGNASGVRITYNGKPFDVAAHATRNIARFRLE